MATLSEIIEEYVVIEKILRYAPQWLRGTTLSLSTLLDVCSLTIANLAERLMVAEAAFEEPPPILLQDGKLYLTEEEWNVHHMRRDAENVGSGGSRGMGGNSGGNGGRGGDDHSRGRGRRNGGHGL
jgi:uncharacterized membrane protein YgcG